MTTTILAYPDLEKKFTGETDASIQGLGPMVLQHQADGKLYPVTYASRAFDR